MDVEDCTWRSDRWRLVGVARKLARLYSLACIVAAEVGHIGFAAQRFHICYSCCCILESIVKGSLDPLLGAHSECFAWGHRQVAEYIAGQHLDHKDNLEADHLCHSML